MYPANAFMQLIVAFIHSQDRIWSPAFMQYMPARLAFWKGFGKGALYSVEPPALWCDADLHSDESHQDLMEALPGLYLSFAAFTAHYL